MIFGLILNIFFNLISFPLLRIWIFCHFLIQHNFFWSLNLKFKYLGAAGSASGGGRKRDGGSSGGAAQGRVGHRVRRQLRAARRAGRLQNARLLGTGQVAEGGHLRAGQGPHLAGRGAVLRLGDRHQEVRTAALGREQLRTQRGRWRPLLHRQLHLRGTTQSGFKFWQNLIF